ncbi:MULTISPECIES: AMP-dependent synthetase/ligase [Rhodococcus]|uniref:AMP-dependent synthetase/ligase n=1 Tax=Rhodococcus TaxID=1827 RepID=UPI0002FCF413|nr:MULTISPECIES: AMP-dependent synthetase/ligase [Rhodococcus]QQZ14752.1 long-chain fatty acid--CoA ligase [Rhodococcus sp. 21391]
MTNATTPEPRQQGRDIPALSALTLCAAFQTTAQARGDQIALRTADGGVALTWREYAERVGRVAAGLAALGVERGDTVALMLTNRPEFHIADMAALHLGAAPFSVYNTLTPRQIAEVCANAGPRVAVTERRFLEQVKLGMADIEHVVLVDADSGVEGVLRLEELEAPIGSGINVEETWRAVDPEDLLTIIYTSGTTGPSKGVELTHANVLHVLRAMTERFSMQPGGRAVSHLPAAHIGDRWANHYWPVLVGAEVTCVPEPRDLHTTLKEVRPTYFGAVPRTWEKLKDTIERSGLRHDAGEPGPLESLGLGDCRFGIVGAAPTPPSVIEFFAGLGLPLCDVWGMSETAGLATATPPERIKAGSVGLPLPGVELRTAPDGELLLRGGMVMRGYRADPARTAEALDEEGWLHTGDLAEVDDDGYVRIVDRKKDIIINASGKNMSPANIESVLKAASPLVGHVVCIGDARPYNVALVVPDSEALAGRPASDPDVHSEIASAIDRANADLARVEQIKTFTVVDAEWLPGGVELTPTMKLRRRPIMEKYADRIEQLYDRSGPP